MKLPLLTTFAALALFVPGAQSQATQSGPIPPTLKVVPIRLPDNIDDFVRDQQWAITLGKALYWDMQAGSDGITACATCHYHAGADNRSKNQLNPDNAHTSGAPLAITYDPTATGGGGANYTPTLADFPFHRLADPLDRDSDVLFTTDDVMGSQGVFPRTFNQIMSGQLNDDCDCDSNEMNVAGVQARSTTGRNTPSSINAILNARQFWDGRANMHFNGVDPFGLRNPAAVVYEKIGLDIAPIRVDIFPASLASQAVGPPLSGAEMSCAGRSFPELGRKMLRLKPLGLQMVDATDSVLGVHAEPGGPGLTATYGMMIRKAFEPRWWAGRALTPDGFRQMEANFSLYWGLALLMYESTLVSDDSPFDQFREGDLTALTADEGAGMLLFFNQVNKCHNCHVGAEFTGAAISHQFPVLPTSILPNDLFIENMIMGDGTQAFYDGGFYNIGVTPTVDDIGTGGTDPFGNPLSFARQVIDKFDLGIPAPDPEAQAFDPCALVTTTCVPFNLDVADAVDGSFKTPGLRNIELTGPYFHSGSYGTLKGVVEFYNRGGNRRLNADLTDTTGFGPNGSNLDEVIAPLGMTDAEVDSMVAFMKALTDERVRWEAAPFDHPQLFLLEGIEGDELLAPPITLCNGILKGKDEFNEIPAVGAAGRSAIPGVPPLESFEESLE
jgi:cytochrome c peroxidase